ncbi:hypothetical protein MD484_g4950, partial [Candolleomyces efflorescens]
MSTLPVELVFEVARHAWDSSLRPLERKALLSSALLVNTLWTAAFVAVLATEVHILDRPFMNYYLKLLNGDSVISRFAPPPQVISGICRSLTLYISNDTLPSIRSRTEPEAEKLLSDCLRTVKKLDALPNLKALKIFFQNVSCEDIFRHHRFADFPEQVESLELEYTFTSSLPRWTIPMPHLLPPGDNPNWILPKVRRLRVVGGFDDLMKLVFVCPKIESFEMESCRYWDHQSRKDMRDESLIRTLFFRGLPAKYEHALPTQSEGRPVQKLFVFTEDPVKAEDGALTYFWWLSHDFSLGDITDYENVQYISCQSEEGA